MRICDVKGCGRKHLAKGYCSAHYKRWRRHGDPEAGQARGAALDTEYSPTVRDLEWAAGFLEGDGHFGTYGDDGDGVTATQTRKPALKRLLKIFGGAMGEVKCSHSPPEHSKQWVWRAYGSRARGIMLTLYPMLCPYRQAQIEDRFLS